MDGHQRMLDRFVRLCEIPSPTGQERAVADDVIAELRGLGVEVSEDEAAQPARAGAGNLIARIPGSGEEWLMFCAHLDTVPHDGPIEVVREAGVYGSRGDTILGADNKAAVTVLVELAARLAASTSERRRRARLHGRRGGRPARRQGARPLVASVQARICPRSRQPDR